MCKICRDILNKTGQPWFFRRRRGDSQLVSPPEGSAQRCECVLSEKNPRSCEKVSESSCCAFKHKVQYALSTFECKCKVMALII